MQYDEFIKISLHNHFGGKAADRELNSNVQYSFDQSYAKRQINDAKNNGYEILGFTNKNKFVASDFNSLNQYCLTKDILLLPGVEFDIVNDLNFEESKQKFLHTIVIFSPDANLTELENKIDECINNNKINAVTIVDLVNKILQKKCIIIPHGEKQQKKKRGIEDNIVQFTDITNMAYYIPIMIEDNKKIHTSILIAKLSHELSEEKYVYISENVPSVSAADRLNFSEIKEPTFLWGEKSFDSLYFASIMGQTRILREPDLNNKVRYIKKIKIINNGGALQNCELSCSHGLNTIIGNSGSGKTLLLNLLNKKLTGKNLSSAVSSTKCEYDELYENSEIVLYDNEGRQIEQNEINVFEGENLYKQIISTLSSDKSGLLELLDVHPNLTEFDKIFETLNDNFKTYISNRIEKRNLKKEVEKNYKLLLSSIEFLNANSVSEKYVEYIKNSKYYTEAQKSKKLIKECQDDLYEFETCLKRINELLTKYDISKISTSDVLYKLFIKKNAISTLSEEQKKIMFDTKCKTDDKIYDIVVAYNNAIGAKQKSFLESKQNVENTIENIINCLKRIVILDAQLEVPFVKYDALLKSIKMNENENVRLSNIAVKVTYDYEDLNLLFGPSIGNSQTKIKKSQFKKLFYSDKKIDITKVDDVKSMLEIYIDNLENLENDIYNFIEPVKKEIINYNIEIKNLDGVFQDIASLSAGQLSKIYIKTLIDNKMKVFENNAIIVYDQPDNNLEKKFILDILCDKLIKLKKSYQIFITTHEPLLVVNADSNSIIQAINEKFVGSNNAITYINLSFISNISKENAVKEIAEIIDGSHEAIKLRNQIYGGMKNE